MADYCTACGKLKEQNAEFVQNGVTTAICNSIKNNTGLKPSLGHKNCEDLGDVNACLINSLIEKLPGYNDCDWKEAFLEYVTNQEIFNELLVCNECGQWKAIDDINNELNNIWNEINNIYILIGSIVGGQYTRLVKGRDYSLNYYNGFVNPGGDLYVGVIKTNDRYVFRISTQLGENPPNTLTHQNMENIDLRHSNPIEEWPKSRMFGITFLGEYAFLNNSGTFINNTSQPTGHWNLRPVSARATWQATTTLSRKYDGRALVASITSYADGWNTQFTEYNQHLTLSSANLLYDFSILI